MRRTCLTVVMWLMLCGTAHPQSAHSHATKATGAEAPATLVRGLGSHRHPASTSSPEAQKFFDQGLRYVYAFNHDEAVRSFRRAAQLDPQMAMAHWGIALAFGPNINLEAEADREKAAYQAVQQALALSAKGPENERLYIEALARRHSAAADSDPARRALDYRNAMGELVKRYPDDLDAATLFAEAGMNLRPWQLWTADGKPAEGTLEIVAVLESVLKRDPGHIGAIHYHIHAVEASPNPERALAYAPRLGVLAPAAGHLVHMPSHIYQRTGDYAAAARSNQEAARADEAYIRARGVKGLYPVMYYSHNLHFLAVAHSMAGRRADALGAAKRLEAHVAPHFKEMPMVEGFMATSTLLLVRFGKWSEILRLPSPDPAMRTVYALWRFARGSAFAGQREVARAEREHEAFLEAGKRLPEDDGARTMLTVAERVLRARIAAVKGETEAALELLRQGVELEDTLPYGEPPAWYSPVRESLGGALLRARRHAEAETVFRADLERNRRSGRSLFGLAAALKAQGKTYEARLVEKEFEKAWAEADTRLALEDL
jgi:tetratricopeptide (TPR) repeat protein